MAFSVLSPVSLLPPGSTVSSMLYTSLALLLLCGLSADADPGKAAERRRRGAKGVYDDGGNGDLSKVEVDMTVEDYAEPQKLKCHNCYLSVDGQSCMSMDDFSQINVQECMSDEPYCMVESLYTDHEVTTFTRKCSRECQSGCQVAGDTYRLESCASCCQEDYCNGDIAGAHLPTASPLLLLVLLSALTLLQRAFSA